MKKINQRLKKTFMKDEMLRLQKLINLSYSLDPRVKLLKKLQEEERILQKKLEKERKDKEKEENDKRMKDNTVNLKPVN